MKLNPEQFALTYDGLLSSPKGFAAGERRVIGKILDKLEAVAAPTEIRQSPAGAVISFRVAAEVDVAIEEVERKLIVTALDATEWTAIAVRRVDQLVAYWRDGVPEKDAQQWPGFPRGTGG